MKNNQTGFTLVELIVVIAILAILWTIAFISIQSYAAISRNAVRIDGIWKIATALEVRKTSGGNVLSFIDSWQEVPSAQIGWGSANIWVDYKAWSINMSALQLRSRDFKDPSTDDVLRAWATAKKWGEYQVIATLEDNGSNLSKISGTYEKRNSVPINGIWTSWKKTFKISDARNINQLHRWDVVTGTWVPSGTRIKEISKNWLTITLDNTFTATSNAIRLWSEEVDGLVASIDGVSPVVNESTTVAYEVLD